MTLTSASPEETKNIKKGTLFFVVEDFENSQINAICSVRQASTKVTVEINMSRERIHSACRKALIHLNCE